LDAAAAQFAAGGIAAVKEIPGATTSNYVSFCILFPIDLLDPGVQTLRIRP
jgi:hypothetical protein